MKMYIMIILIGCNIVSLQASVSNEYQHSQAAYAAQQGNWQAAQKALHTVLLDQPDNIEACYDLGVCAYKQGSLKQAKAYFDTVASCKDAPHNLRCKAYYNRGNTNVALKQLQDAVSDYDTALKINPADEHAKHNKNIVQQMLMQQQSQDSQNQDSQSQDGDTKNDGKQQAKGDDSQKQDGQDSQSQDSQSQDGDKKNDGKKSKNSKQKSEKSDKGESSQEQDDDLAEDGGDSQEGSDQEDERDSGKQSEDKFEGNEADESGDKGSKSHASSPDKKDDGSKNCASQDAKDDAKEQAMQEAEVIPDYRAEKEKALDEKLSAKDKWMARVLKQRDDVDEKLNKNIIKETLKKEAVGNHGKNNW